MRAIPKILIRIKREKAWLRHFVGREGVDLVISDNRYGLTTSGVPCVFITHQLLIKTPFGSWGDRFLQLLNYRLIRHFSRCWVPDVAIGGLAGDLSHPRHMPPILTRYIGWLSRFGSAVSGSGAPGTSTTAGNGSPDNAPAPLLLALLSGPEPGRTLLEKDILRQVQAMAGKVPLCRLMIVRGLPGNSESLVPARSAPPTPLASALPPWLTIHNHLPAKALEPLLRAANLVLARPGYSTVMDLERLGKHALFIPTPGQSEQEYLGPYLAAKGWAACAHQRAFSLAEAFEMAVTVRSDRARQPEDPGLLAAEIKAVLDSLEDPAA